MLNNNKPERHALESRKEEPVVGADKPGGPGLWGSHAEHRQQNRNIAVRVVHVIEHVHREALACIGKSANRPTLEAPRLGLRSSRPLSVAAKATTTLSDHTHCRAPCGSC